MYTFCFKDIPDLFLLVAVSMENILQDLLCNINYQCGCVLSQVFKCFTNNVNSDLYGSTRVTGREARVTWVSNHPVYSAHPKITPRHWVTVERSSQNSATASQSLSISALHTLSMV